MSRGVIGIVRLGDKGPAKAGGKKKDMLTLYNVLLHSTVNKTKYGPFYEMLYK